MFPHNYYTSPKTEREDGEMIIAKDKEKISVK